MKGGEVKLLLPLSANPLEDAAVGEMVLLDLLPAREEFVDGSKYHLRERPPQLSWPLADRSATLRVRPQYDWFQDCCHGTVGVLLPKLCCAKLSGFENLKQQSDKFCSAKAKLIKKLQVPPISFDGNRHDIVRPRLNASQGPCTRYTVIVANTVHFLIPDRNETK